MHGASDHPAPPCKRLSTLHVPPHVSAFQLPKHFPMQGTYSSPCTSTWAMPRRWYFVADLWQVEARICVAGEGVLHSLWVGGSVSEARPSTAVRYHEDFLGLHFNIFPGAVQVSLGRPKNTIRVTAKGKGRVGGQGKLEGTCLPGAGFLTAGPSLGH